MTEEAMPRALLLESDQIQAMCLVRMCENADFHATWVKDARSALETLALVRVDLLILDVESLSERTDDEVEVLRRLAGEIPAIYVADRVSSSTLMCKDQEDRRPCGPFDYLLGRPFDAEEVRQMCNHVRSWRIDGQTFRNVS
jgi:CheY-like chemotaxis protein